MTTEGYMHRCFELAERAKGHTAPNPMVGAVLVSGDRIIGEGWHHHYGADHAEVNCIKNVAVEDRHLIPGSTMYVSLEPCAHHGITPPCAHRLVQEKIGEVIIANTDPFEQVNGNGVQILLDAGINVRAGVCEKEGRWLNRRFFCFHSRHRPYIILKWAQTRDGFIAPADRSRLQISSGESSKLLHKWRTQECAIMVGAITARLDNPQLTARHWEGEHPLRIVLDRNLQLPHTHHIFDNTAATWVINDQREILDGNVHSIKLPFGDALLPALMQRLHSTRILSLIVEGGASLLTSFIAQNLWDEARIFTGTAEIGEGVAAPALQNEVSAFATTSGSDQMHVFTNLGSHYPYPGDMEL
jgi:diaminohydroxyphosphoribosylaminopyrimidine deaminase / 5-amino-6-(5-phosphoribosylamino)uracil reductase